jgi:hypothetical protein
LVADITLDKCIAGVILEMAQVVKVARIGKLVINNDPIIGISLQQISYKVRADETCSPGDH